MIRRDSADRLGGSEVRGIDDERIGTVERVFVHGTTGDPAWASVRTGPFGLSESYVPLLDATYTDGVVHIAYGKDLVKRAPDVGGTGVLSSADQVQLQEHYGARSAASPVVRPEFPSGSNDPRTKDQPA